MKLTGQLAEKYSIYYRVHSSNYGWLDWTCDGKTAGTTGFGLAAEAIQIKLVKKGDKAPGPTTRPAVEASSTTLSAHATGAN